MLSKAAFNALLKTLEEPPEHVKFIFATTEIRKVPITVLSRCQRFDLRRIEPDVLADYYGQIAGKENVTADEDALSLIARAADGSVRDGLSLLDQAIALGDGSVTGDQVKEMLGLADRALILDLLEHALKGRSSEALVIMHDLYQKGADPIVIMQDLLDLSHQLTKHRALPQSPTDAALPKGEQERLSNLADALSMPTLGRTWQILLKGLGEVNIAPNPQKAAEMIIIRLLYAADLPDPAELVKKLKDQPAGSVTPSIQAPANNGGGNATIQSDTTPKPMAMEGGAPTQSAAQPKAQESDLPPATITSIQDVVSTLEQGGEMVLATHISMYAHPIKIEQGLIEFRAAENAPPRLSQDLSQKMKAITGNRWVVTISETQTGGPTLAQLRDKAEEELRAHVLDQPLVKNILEFFPDAKLKEITKK
jgi:DNA polymerase-3 subunit gamma/tau